ncbi:alpha/beta fold hydrolase [Stackebrandtia nassauensis]|uniref:Alpha/beta hydrolase fold protein n=1 Tax=Stackebrandtia nassauensis (strain DSM 44728 / CIP 108903 / NRRL B-16338 / NBRC 102104 / LLR-40K-21) TaxID=446470 RepID=D3PVE8_STANL|nr:alpha/beta hydrolase [Stackebrandtia nassauensis]ADD43062.1 alpha/beta hydrolase fold protein [Stackebrandtia nassauensis DSM 44728]
MTITIPGFDTKAIDVADGVSLNAAVGGDGPAIILLHGFPQTHLMWRHVAPVLAEHHTVIAPDLRGYGASAKPAALDPDTYSKRTMAADIVGLADALGIDRFTLVGHDRGAHVAFRAGLDHPNRVSQLGILDILPTLDTWNVLQGVNAAVAFHLYLMAQPVGLPEQMIANSSDAFFGFFLDAWNTGPDAIPADVRAEYLNASRQAVDSIVADVRATATIDIEHDQADLDAGNRLAMPVTVIQQDWGQQLGFDAAATWRPWAADLEHFTTRAGHFMAETAPDDIATLILNLAKR